MADLLGGNPNLLDDVFKSLEDWEEILKSVPELSDNEPLDNPSLAPPPDLTLDM